MLVLSEWGFLCSFGCGNDHSGQGPYGMHSRGQRMKCLRLPDIRSYNQNMSVRLDVFLFVFVCACLNLYQCGNVVGATAKHEQINGHS